ncbi:MAG: transporter substrate-binding domain-containing protein [Erysipelotrichaceae bacterium]|nr:transporter substrate-binding domain-containing protein [Erysipelotrichaceae bacterium]
MKKASVILLIVLLLAGCTKETDNAEETAVYVRKDLSAVTSLSGLKQTDIAIQTVYEEELLKQAEEVEAFFYDSTDMEVTVVKAEAIDGALMEETKALYYCTIDPELAYLPFRNNENGFSLDASTADRILLLKKNSSLTAEINEQIASVDEDTRLQLMKDVLKVCNGQPISRFALETEEPEEYSGTLKVGIEEGAAPYCWKDEEEPSFGSHVYGTEKSVEQTCNGYDVRFAKYLADSLGYRLEIYIMDRQTLLDALDRSAIDVAFGSFTSAEADSKYSQSLSYFDTNYVILYKK